MRDSTRSHLREHALTLAGAVLKKRGLPTFDADLVDGGAQAFVVRFPSAELCVRVTLGESPATLRGYAVSEALGPDLALPLCEEPAEMEDTIVATFPLAQVIATRTEAWGNVLDLVDRVHGRDIDPAWDLPPVDLTTGLAERFSALERSPFQPWAAPLRREVANVDAAIRVATRHLPRALLHGDAHAGQVMNYGGRSLLIDFDRVAHGPIEADYGRLWAFFSEGRLDEGLFTQLYENSAEDPSYGLLSSYGRLYVIRDATWLATRAASLGADDLRRLHACSRVLGLVDAENITFEE